MIYLAFAINFILVLLVINGRLMFHIRDSKSDKPHGHWYFFIYFTSDSNVFAGLSSFLVLPYLLQMIRGVGSIPLWVQALRFMSSVSVCVTMLTVLVFLAPKIGYADMYAGSDFYYHLLIPLASTLTYAFLEPAGKIPFYFTFLGLIPVVIYGIIYAVQTIFIGLDKGGWRDFYHFNDHGQWILSLTIMFFGTYLISLGIYYLQHLGCLL